MGKIANKEQREKVFELCETLGFWNVRPSIVAQKYGMVQQNVSRWKDSWIKKHGMPQVEKHSKLINVHSQTLLREIIKLCQDPDKKIRLEAIKTFFDAQEKFTKFLESFGYKAVVAQPTVDNQITVAFGVTPDEEKNSASTDRIIDVGQETDKEDRPNYMG